MALKHPVGPIADVRYTRAAFNRTSVECVINCYRIGADPSEDAYPIILGNGFTKTAHKTQLHSAIRWVKEEPSDQLVVRVLGQPEDAQLIDALHGSLSVVGRRCR